jgi:hypothetical protein
MTGLAARVREPGAWLWLALALGAALRVWLVVATEGTFDVAIKLHHGRQVNQLGLLEYYRQAPVFNHPPPMGGFFAAAASLAADTGVPFRVWLRAPFAALDLATAGLLLVAFAGSPWRLAIFAGYWLHPLAILFSAYHGNTDTAVAFFGLLSLVLVSSGRSAAAGAALGAGLWVKLPILMAAPALCLALPGWRERARFAAVAAAVALLGYLPALEQAPLVFGRIAGYGGSPVTTPAGLPIWGLAHVLGLADTGLARGLERANAVVCLLPILALAWLRRGRAAAPEVGLTVCGGYLAVYGLTSHFAWQYLAWSLPFWFCLDRRANALLSLVISAYVYGAYALFTGSPWLAGRWDFTSVAAWPWPLAALRAASVLACLGVAAWVLGRELRRGGGGRA